MTPPDDPDEIAEYRGQTWIQDNLKIQGTTIKSWGMRGLVRTRYGADSRNRQQVMYSLEDVVHYNATRTTNRTPHPPVTE